MKTSPLITLDQLEQGRLLKDLTTFGIGGPAKYFIEVDGIPAMQDLLAYCHAHQIRYFILGKGSNTLFDDRGFNGMVIANRINFLEKPEEDCWHVGAGYSFSLLGSQTARQGWSGLEFASGIPGSVGGAVYMNAGANGRETSETLVSVDYVTPEGRLICLEKSDLTFRYRFSSFQQRTGAIVGATFRLTASDSAREKQLEIIHYRKKTQPYKAKSAGCVFRNPDCGHAGALIEKSGLKGKSEGGAQVSSIHANFVINTGNASSQDVLSLVDSIQQEVKKQMGISLESEIRYIPYDQGDFHPL
ncbi:UDP-N-acetylmuramate dehydrogenase [Candidatus Protochlamydia phocaeensis]|uniref:UDP-N-acetylmuramate dehydrogenase n=1 Tax=Candidatus Protochlamydia phocaeensis TaxID=1414722 RepID=UPI000838362F|nr:UDP-N-acetylmuramate dehydrogenase [Candidatus Protochlamydia phocaeensis]